MKRWWKYPAALIFVAALFWTLCQVASLVTPEQERAFEIADLLETLGGAVGAIVCWLGMMKKNAPDDEAGLGTSGATASGEAERERKFDEATASVAELYREGRLWAFGFKAETKTKIATDDVGNAVLKEYRVFNVTYGVGLLRRVALKRRTAWNRRVALAAQADLAFLYRRGYEDALPKPEEAFRLALKPAKKGNPFALYVLGRCYDVGQGAEKNEEKAREHYEKALQKLRKSTSDPVAANLLGRLYYKGWGTERSEAKAAEFFATAANAGYADGMNSYAVCLSDGKGQIENPEKALELFAKAAELGHAGAKVNLGAALFADATVGEEGKKKKAFELFVEAAASGSDAARNALGECYLYGDGVEPNLEKAFEYFEKAAAQGLPDAKFNLGRCYYNGRGVCEDKAKALALYEEASRLGLDDATTRLGRCYHYGEGVEENKERATALYEKAAANGDALASYLLGNCYFDAGKKTEAIERYEEAVALGSADAATRLAFCYRYGYGVAKTNAKPARITSPPRS